MRRNIIVTVLLLSFTTVHLAAVDVMCYRVHKVYDYVINEYRRNPDQPIFATEAQRFDAPWICLQKPYYGMFTHYEVVRDLAKFWGEKAYYFGVVPESLRHFNPAEAEPIPGQGNFYWSDGLIIGPKIFPSTGVFYTAETGTEPYRNVRARFVIPFVTADGNEYSIYFPANRINIEIMLKLRPKSIYNIPTPDD